MKRIVSSLLIMIMALSLFAGCGKKKEKETGNGSYIGGDVTLTVALPSNGRLTDFDTNSFTLYIEEALGVNLECKTYSTSSDEFLQQLTLESVSGMKLPDVIVGYPTLGETNISDFGHNGVFIDLTELMDKYAVNYKEHYDKLSKEEQELIQYGMTDIKDGKIYGMPYLSQVYGLDVMQTNVNINQTWLDKLGLKAPTTLDELYTVLKAFKEKDPNGNGKKDEIPIIGENAVYYIINAFIYHHAGYPINIDENGKLYYSSITDEYRDALIFCNKLRKEGLLDEKNFTLSSRQEFMALITPSDDVAKVGIFAGHPMLVCSETSNILNQYVAIDALKGKTDLGGYTPVLPQTFFQCGFITRDCKNPEAAMKFLDYCYVDETVARMKQGEKGVDWDYGTGTSLFGTEAKMVRLTESTGINHSWGCNLPQIATYENEQAAIEISENPYGQINRLVMEQNQIMKKAKFKEETTMRLRYNEEQRKPYNETSYNINTYMRATSTKFMIGEMDPSDDKQWNAYVKEIEKRGLADLLKLMQGVYDEQKK